MVDLCHQGLNFCSGVYCSYFFHLLAFSCKTVRNNSSGLLTGSHGNSSIVSIVTFWFFSKNWTKRHSIELIYFPQKTLGWRSPFYIWICKNCSRNIPCICLQPSLKLPSPLLLIISVDSEFMCKQLYDCRIIYLLYHNLLHF